MALQPRSGLTVTGRLSTPTPTELRKFGLVLGLLFASFFGLLFPWIGDGPVPAWPWIVAGVLASISIIAPVKLAKVYLAWMKLGHILGWINTRIILGAIFFLILLPTAVVLRFRGRDPLHRGFEPGRETYLNRSTASSIKRLEKPF